MDTASKGTLETEFGTAKDDDVIAQIIEKGDIVETEVWFFVGAFFRPSATDNVYRTTLAMATVTTAREPARVVTKRVQEPET